MKFPNKNAIKIESKNYPLKATVRPDNGLTLFLRSNPELNPWSLCKFWAFTVHSPYELAGSYDHLDVCNFHFGADIEVLITPEIMRTDENLKNYSPDIRGCFYENEKKLKYFKIYSRRNCELECFADILIGSDEKMLCAPFYFVRNDSVQVCDIRVERRFQQAQSYFRDDFNGRLKNCHCLDECNSIKYNVEVLEYKRTDYKDIILSKYYEQNNVTISFRFQDNEINPRKRYQPWTFLEFLAQSGGLMGLFAGISALSVIEIFYFLTLRLLSNICAHLKQIFDF